MKTVKVNNVEIEVSSANEAREVARIGQYLALGDKEGSQRAADVWMRSAPTAAAERRRKAGARALGLSDVVAFL